MSKKNHTPQASPDQVGWPLIQSFQSELTRMFDRFNATSWGADPKVMPVLDIAKPADVAGSARKIDVAHP